MPTVAFAKDLAVTNSFTTLSGQNIIVNKTGNSVLVQDQLRCTSQVVAADIAIANGVVHVIKKMMLPDLMLPNVVEVANAAGLTTLIAAVTTADLGGTVLNAPAITVFAPFNVAFSAALQAFGAANLNQLVAKIGGIQNLQTILGFHVVPAVAFASDLAATNTLTTIASQSLTVTKSAAGAIVTDARGNVAKVTTADVAIENGVVHVIDRVLLPNYTLPTAVEAASVGNLTVLLQAETAAGLGNTLLNAEAITVFASTNHAFTNQLTSLNLTSLQGLIDALGVEAVTKILGFHVVPAVTFSFDLAEGDQMVPTLAGEMLKVDPVENIVKVTDAEGKTYSVIAADVAI